jgi:hypothetical protein
VVYIFLNKLKTNVLREVYKGCAATPNSPRNKKAFACSRLTGHTLAMSPFWLASKMAFTISMVLGIGSRYSGRLSHLHASPAILWPPSLQQVFSTGLDGVRLDQQTRRRARPGFRNATRGVSVSSTAAILTCAAYTFTEGAACVHAFPFLLFFC